MTIETGHILTAITLFGGAAGWSYNQFIKPAIRETKEKKKKLYDMVSKIHHEMNFNNGGSIKDVVNRIEARIKNLENNQRVVMNVQNIAFWESNENGFVTYVSPALCKLVGRSESEILGNNWVSCIDPVEKESVFDAWKFSIENNTPFDQEYTYKKESGELVRVWGLAFHRVINNKLVGSLGKLEALT